jgi:hypothetical protein
LAVYSVLPDTLDLVFVQGDELSVFLDFDIDLSGYGFETRIIEVLGVENGNVTAFNNVMPFTKTVISLEEGQINLSLDESQTQSLSLVGNYRWFMRWTAPGLITRTVLSGSVSVRSP